MISDKYSVTKTAAFCRSIAPFFCANLNKRYTKNTQKHMQLSLVANRRPYQASVFASEKESVEWVQVGKIYAMRKGTILLFMSFSFQIATYRVFSR